jgi:hypothetical protein
MSNIVEIIKVIESNLNTLHEHIDKLNWKLSIYVRI